MCKSQHFVLKPNWKKMKSSFDPAVRPDYNNIVLSYEHLEPQSDEEVITRKGDCIYIHTNNVCIMYDAPSAHQKDKEWYPSFVCKLLMKDLKSQLPQYEDVPAEHELYLYMELDWNLSKVLAEARKLALGINKVKLKAYGMAKVKLMPGDVIDILTPAIDGY